jgi:ketosteroid isomerase-like protein
MRPLTVRFAAALASVALMAHGDSPKSAADLSTLHAAWFDAFDHGDGAKMDQMETPNLVLVMPDGTVWKKSEPRAKVMKAHSPDATRELSDVSVREFGDTALLTGSLISRDTKTRESDSTATTVVFVKRDGKWLVASAQWTPQAPPAKP